MDRDSPSLFVTKSLLFTSAAKEIGDVCTQDNAK